MDQKKSASNSRNRTPQLKTITKIGSKLLQLDGERNSFYLENGQEQTEYSGSRCTLYSSLEAYQTEMHTEYVCSKVRSYFHGYQTSMSLDQAVQIAKILNIDIKKG
jgi:hypothetical protein